MGPSPRVRGGPFWVPRRRGDFVPVPQLTAGFPRVALERARPGAHRGALRRVPRVGPRVYFEKIGVLKAGPSGRLNSRAWNNGRGLRCRVFVGSWALEVMVERDGRGHSYCRVRGEILRSRQDGLLRKHLPRMFSLIKNESQRFEGDQIPP